MSNKIVNVLFVIMIVLTVLMFCFALCGFILYLIYLGVPTNQMPVWVQFFLVRK